MTYVHPLDWSALLIGGPSSVGKSTAAAQIGRRLGIQWLHVDDLRLALQWSRVTLPARTEALYFFEETPNILRLPPERLRDGLIGVAEAMARAVEIVVDNHVHIAAPVVIEGNDILPSLLTRPVVQEHAVEGQARLVVLIESDEQQILTNMLDRGRGIAEWTETELRTRARAYWLYGQWLAHEAQRRGLPVLEARPWTTLAERILAASSAPQRAL
jgi:2-phosphoglycerate kinase